MFCNSRYYVPEWGRWLNADDVSYLDPSSINGLNLYAYCGNTPVMLVDPNGNFAFLTLLLIGAVVGTVIGGGVSTVTQLIENDWEWSEVNWGVVAIDAVFGAIEGALSVRCSCLF
ncbi:MAG: hypothetical protein PHY83_04685 [Bacilli bacterium]|nr:hypothetical protein [Bacilli bacterium]MDD2682016.1 hypothetical protein [Bacilli bacterium]